MKAEKSMLMTSAKDMIMIRSPVTPITVKILAATAAKIVVGLPKQIVNKKSQNLTDESPKWNISQYKVNCQCAESVSHLE